MEREEDTYTLMMDALDGELSEAGWAELESHLRARPALAREWETLRAVDALLKRAPMLQPAADFTQRTLARIPDSRRRLWAGVTLYFLLLASGIIPLGAIVWIAVQVIPLLGQPTLLRGLLQAGAGFVQMIQAVFGALLNGAGEFVDQQPLALAYLSLMAAIVALWAGVYGRLVLYSRRSET